MTYYYLIILITSYIVKCVSVKGYRIPGTLPAYCRYSRNGRSISACVRYLCFYAACLLSSVRLSSFRKSPLFILRVFTTSIPITSKAPIRQAAMLKFETPSGACGSSSVVGPITTAYSEAAIIPRMNQIICGRQRESPY